MLEEAVVGVADGAHLFAERLVEFRSGLETHATRDVRGGDVIRIGKPGGTSNDQAQVVIDQAQETVARAHHRKIVFTERAFLTLTL